MEGWATALLTSIWLGHSEQTEGGHGQTIGYVSGFSREIRREMTRSLTTAYHPPADGQTKLLNQSLEISLRAYIGPSRNNWVKYIDALALSYNTTPHMATGFAPAYLLHGYTPVTSSTLLHNSKGIPQPATGTDSSDEWRGTINQHSGTSLHPIALEMTEAFLTERHHAQEALMLGQHFQRRSYNHGRLALDFTKGSLVLLNSHSLCLLRNETGHGRKLLMKYDSPFEVIQKLSPVSYRLWIPESYGIHPILNIAHLEKYQPSPSEFGN